MLAELRLRAGRKQQGRGGEIRGGARQEDWAGLGRKEGRVGLDREKRGGHGELGTNQQRREEEAGGSKTGRGDGAAWAVQGRRIWKTQSGGKETVPWRGRDGRRRRSFD